MIKCPWCGEEISLYRYEGRDLKELWCLSENCPFSYQNLLEFFPTLRYNEEFEKGEE